MIQKSVIVRPIAIVQSDTTVYREGIEGLLMGILVSAGGNLVVKNDKGTQITIVVPTAGANGGVFPNFIPGPFTAVMAATTIGDADMIGYQQA